MPTSLLNDPSEPMRILMSSSTIERLGKRVRAVMGDRSVELVCAHGDAQQAPGKVHAAFISRDVTGKSTKHEVGTELAAFYASLRDSPDLRWVHVHSAGSDRPIFGELRARGVHVTTSSGANAEVVAQTALAGILALAREFPRLGRAQREHRWASLIGGALPRDLSGQRALIVGWGPIGARIGQFLQMLGLTVTAARTSAGEAHDGVPMIAFEDVAGALPQVDWLVLACPLSERTRHLLSAQALTRLKPGMRVVNVSRGEVVDQVALIDALQDGRMAGAFLDVFDYEPLAADSVLWDLPNVIVTPHSAGHSNGNEARVDDMFLRNLREQAGLVS